jgi:hypothetical protein
VRRRTRWLVALALAGVFVLLAGRFGLSRLAGRRLGQYLTQRIGVAVEIDAVHLRWPLAIAADGFVLRLAADGEPVLRAARLSVWPDVRALARGKARLRRAELERPFLHLRREPGGTMTVVGVPSDHAANGARGAGVALVVDRVEIRDGVVRVTDAGRAKEPAFNLRVFRLDVPRLRMYGEGGFGRTRFEGEIGLARGGGVLSGEYRGRGPEAGLHVDGRLVDLDLVPLADYLPGPRLARGRAAGTLAFDWRDDLFRLQGDVVLTDLDLGAEPGVHLTLAWGRFAGSAFDLRRRTLTVGDAAARDVGVAVPSWPPITLRAIRGRRLATAPRSGSVVAAGVLDDGGSARFRGTLGTGANAVRGELKLAAVPLPRLLAAHLPAAVRVSEGRLSARTDVSALPLRFGPGTVTVERFDAVSATATGRDPMLAFDRLDAAVARIALDPVDVDVERLRLAWPHLVLRREAAGVYPFHAPTESSAGDAAGVTVRIGAAKVHDGTIFFEDRRVEPRFLGSLSHLRAAAAGVTFAPLRAAAVDLGGMVNDVAPLVLRGTHAPAGSTLAGSVGGLPLPPLNPYLGPLTGYTAREGEADAGVDVGLTAGNLHGTVTLALARLAVERAGGEDLIDGLVGIPTTLALGLMKDPQGRLHLTLPLRGDPSVPEFALRGVVLGALRDALLGVLWSPLKVLGAWLERDVARDDIHVEPVACVPGRPDASARGENQLDRLAVLLSQHPVLAATLRGRAGAEDGVAGRAELAAARATWVQQRLVERYGIAAERVTLGAAAAAGPPAVLIELVAAANRTSRQPAPARIAATRAGPAPSTTADE